MLQIIPNKRIGAQSGALKTGGTDRTLALSFMCDQICAWRDDSILAG
jgi:hypothetical protein